MIGRTIKVLVVLLMVLIFALLIAFASRTSRMLDRRYEVERSVVELNRLIYYCQPADSTEFDLHLRVTVLNDSYLMYKPDTPKIVSANIVIIK